MAQPNPAAPESCLSRTRARRAAALGLITALALALRLYSIGDQSFWTDEAYTALVYTLPLRQMLARLVADDLHPPLFPLFVELWARLFGTGEVALRLPAALFGALLVPAAAGLTWRLFPGRLGETAGFLAAGLTALSPLITLHAQEARNTTLVALEATLATSALAVALDAPSRRGWLPYAALAAALVYTHYVGFLVLAAHGLYVLAAAPRRLPRLLLADAAVALVFAPWAPFAWRQLTGYHTYLPATFSAPTVLAELLSSYLSGLVPPEAIRPLLPLVGLGLLGLLSAAVAVAPRSARRVLLPLLVAVVPVATMLVVWSVVPKINPRYLVPVASAVYVVLGWVLAALLAAPRRPVAAFGGGLALAALIGSGAGLGGTYAAEKDDYRGLVAELSQDAGPNDAVLALMELDEPVRYYYRGPLPEHHLIAQDDFAATAGRLNTMLAGRSNVWLITFAEQWADPSGWVRHALGEQSASPMFDKWYGTTRLTGFKLEPGRLFTAEPAPSHLAGARFANGVELIGWDVLGGGAYAGRETTIDWHWRATRPDTPDFKVVATVEDPGGRELARIDRTPATLIWDPPRWRAGEVVHGQQRFTLPAVTPPGAYPVRFSIYDPATLKEIPAVDPKGRPLGPRVPAGELPLQPSPDVLPDDAVALPRLARPLDFTAGGQPLVRLLAFDPPKDPSREGETIDVGFAWRALARPTADYEAVVRMKSGDKVLDEVAFPPLANHPTKAWTEGALFLERRQLPLPPEVPGGRLELELGLRDPASKAPLAVGGAPFAPLGSLQVRERPASREVPPIQHRTEATLGGAVRLLGYDLDAASAKAGGQLKLTLYWQAVGRVPRREKVFVHLIDERDGIVGQRDAEPRDGQLPTTEWKPGEVVTDPQAVPIKSDAAPGRYRLRVGLYEVVTGERMQVGGGGTYVELGQVDVGR
jgi:mannosyltransferase